MEIKDSTNMYKPFLEAVDSPLLSFQFIANRPSSPFREVALL